ncbi:GSCFA domain-containing protein [Ramlibacter sp.]|uniref:GSCFA domain-containing protein n=1 Tax=Ramlibacter sp. TaxID=1917967 RepID=UPI002FC738B8
MIGEMQPFSTAWQNITSNKARSYPNLKDNGQSGYERVHNHDFPDIKHTPKFSLKRTDRFFTIGSCFARNVERALISQGIDVLNTVCRIPGGFYTAEGPDNRNSALNAYTPHSMLDLIKFAQRNDWQSVAALQVDDAGESWCDMLMAGLRYLNREELLAVREQLLRTYQQLPQADVCVITLGYTEAWFDNRDQVFTNRSPAGARQTARHGDRFSFFNADAASVQGVLTEIVQIIGSLTQGLAKILLTVSPVPLSGTYTQMDVVCANSYSKATLLSAARAVALKFDNVDYFPSYELVTMSKPELAWKKDGAHVKDSIVAQVIGSFLELYLRGS